MILSGVLAAVTCVLVLGIVLPLSKLPHGAIRGLEFPRVQYFCLAVILAVGVWLFDRDWLWGMGWPLLLLIAIVQLVYILKFTPIWRQQSVTAAPELAADGSRRISLLAANVKKSNRDYGALIDLVREHSPDVMMAIEVDADWIAALKHGVGGDFAHAIDVPKDNGYGICVLSRLPLEAFDVREIVTQDVPSVRARVQLRSGHAARLYVVHPEPPIINHDTKGRDSEIALIGMEAADDPLPCIVAGDLNDVAWSTTTRRFQRLSGLLDPRVGRGFFNTFNALVPMMRWPLDHLFHDPQFRLIDMRRLPKIGSDHFPMWFVLALADSDHEGLSPGERSASEASQTKRMIVEERKRPREPIGSHWEDD